MRARREHQQLRGELASRAERGGSRATNAPVVTEPASRPATAWSSDGPKSVGRGLGTAEDDEEDEDEEAAVEGMLSKEKVACERRESERVEAEDGRAPLGPMRAGGRAGFRLALSSRAACPEQAGGSSAAGGPGCTRGRAEGTR